MGEEAGWMFGGVPRGEFRPEGSKFAIAETGFHADPGIVKRDGVTAQERKKPATHRGRPMTRGFGSGKNGGDSGQVAKEVGEFFFGKVVKEKVGENQFCRGRLLGPFEGS